MLRVTWLMLTVMVWGTAGLFAQIKFPDLPPAKASSKTPEPGVAAKPASARSNGKQTEVVVAGDQQWVDTGIDVKRGDTLTIAATGTLQFGGREIRPTGVARSWRDLLVTFPLNDAPRGAVIGRIGEGEAIRPFLIGDRRQSAVPLAGRLFVGINQTSNDKAEGKFTVVIERQAGVATAPSGPVNVTHVTQAQLDSVPRRVQDAEGTPGDRTNFVIVGGEKKVLDSLAAAGWVQVDKSVKDTFFRGLIVTISKGAYVTLPISELQLFGRSQDYGFAMGEPVKVVASRHHFRLWKAPFTAGGETVWIGAGTHDIGFDKDQRNGKITHKIDPDVDLERDFIAKSLENTGETVASEYLTPADPVKTAKTAHGEEFHSDGRTAIIYLRLDNTDAQNQFADYFCSVLTQKNPDGGEWGKCNAWLDGAGKADLALAPLPAKDFRVLVVPGFMSSCFADSPAFLEGTKALQEQYGIDAALLPVPNDGSEANAKVIGDYIRGQMAKDSRKFILVGYSKGGPDVQEALAREEGVKENVMAFVSVAGASGGSPIAEAALAQAQKWVRDFQFGNCQGGISGGFASLKQSVRKQFLASYPHPFVPTYSIVAASQQTNTSKTLLQTWNLLQAYGLPQDGQLLRDDAIVPESKFLGAANADHFAIALPFDKSTDKTIASQMDKTRFPRAALLEAMVRFVLADQKKP